ncbi:MepB family protein [Nocardia sp. NPDC058518]|uniref:MepB family protein n=1 Tax=Nocardia sp. NPDC058518 TaxID=3346534 RepID=UPI00365FF653
MKDLAGTAIREEDESLSHQWDMDPARGSLPIQLTESIREAFETSGLALTKSPTRETESAEYGACRFEVEGRSIAFRVAKTTPTKVGQFVTIWKRPDPASEIAPLDSTDDVSSVIIAAFDRDHRGLFIFNRSELIRRGVMSVAGDGGKRAIRVYAPWVHPDSKQAIQTKRWQSARFVQLQPQESVDADRLLDLIQG